MTPLSSANVSQRLQGPGLVLDLGAMRVRLHSRVAGLAAALAQVYRHFPLDDADPYVDSELRLDRGRDWPRIWQARLRFLADGTAPFESAPAALSLAQLEWGMNWVYAHLFSRHLLLHSGAVERHGVGLMLVASPGSGKSTLTAALSLKGFRVLSDEFGSLRLSDRRLLPLAKPVALKNTSIDLIRTWSPEAVLGPVFVGTHKGDVAHLALTQDSVSRRHEPARPGILIFPTWQADQPVELTRVMPARALSELAHNSFNYSLLGQPAFEAASDLVAGCECYRLTYGRLPDVVPVLEDLCQARSQRMAT